MLYSQCSIVVLVLGNSFLQSSVTNKRGCSRLIAGLGNTTNTCCNTMHHSYTKMETYIHICREERVQRPSTAAHAVNNPKSPRLCAISPFLNQKIQNLRKNWTLLTFSLHIDHTRIHCSHPCGIIEISMKKIIQKSHETSGQKTRGKKTRYYGASSN